MTHNLFLQIIYGVAIVIVLYLLVRQYYSVYYVAGNTVYGSPITQMLFPTANKMAPTWGYNSIGHMSPDVTKYGQESYWPQSGQGYKPKKNGSGGIAPSGLERGDGDIPITEVEVGWWKGDVEQPIRTIQNIYEQREGIPEVKVGEVGHWSA